MRFLSIFLVLLLIEQVLCLPAAASVGIQDRQQSQSSDGPQRKDAPQPTDASQPKDAPQPTDASQPKDAPQLTDAPQPKIDKPAVLHIPDGTPVEIESPYTYSSMHFKPKDEISFRVVNPIIVNGITLIEPGATATGRIEKSKRGGHFGKAGLLLWTMETVTAVDGSQIPLRTTSVRLRGDSKGAKVATQMIITGALLWPIAPVVLLHGFKRGKDAYIPAGKRYEVFIDGQPAVKVK